jgi:2-amino-4-hydroxy-6-hydroxymethyldihydropteridine diphosphokinase
MARAYVAAGSNISPAENIALALRLLAGRAAVTAVSTVYRTKALGRPDQPDYYNLVIEVKTEMPPEEFRRTVLRRIEDKLGRVRSKDRYAPRTIDLDLIACDELALKTDELTLPDPEIAVRPFLSIPLCELNPGLMLPGLGRVDGLAPKLPCAGMEPLLEYTARLKKEFSPGTSPGTP